MKKFLLAILLFASLSTLKAQSLAGTTWADYDTSNTFGMYWNFTVDSTRLGFDLVNWTAIGGYTYTPNTYTMVDNPAEGCANIQDTGVYTTVFSGDTMWLVPVNDPCTERLEYISVHYFLNLMMNVAEQTPTHDFELFPNPSSGNVTISCSEQSVPGEIVVTDMTGRVVHRVTNADNTTVFTLDLQSLPAGAYFVTCDFGDHTSTKRVVRM